MFSRGSSTGHMTFHSIISSQKTPIERNPLFPVAHARFPPFQGHPFGVTRRLMTSRPLKRPHQGGYCVPSGCACDHLTFDDVTSGSHATSGHAQWYILYYYYSKKKAREPVAHAHNMPTDMWLPVTVTWLPVTSLPVAPPRTTSVVNRVTMALLTSMLNHFSLLIPQKLRLLQAHLSQSIMKMPNILFIGNL